MGCVSSKEIKRTRRKKHSHSHSSPEFVVRSFRAPGIVVQSSTAPDNLTLKSNSGSFGKVRFSGTLLDKIKEEPEKPKDDEEQQQSNQESREPEKPEKEKDDEEKAENDQEVEESKPTFPSPEKSSSISVRYAGRLSQGEIVAAGWPPWLCAVAGEAVEGWIPLKSDKFEKLEKIGQGTYSNVFRGRDVETGKMVALKKVRFENFKPESVRFMAREIMILRRLDHPNIMKLEGIIASKLSCSIYLVFEYMEHDLAGLLSCPDIKFTESQIKCFMRQLLCGLEHCHSQGIMHRDVKTANILVNNEGILKIADFGLANFTSTYNKEPLTSRVVTLWYRPPELLLGSTNYGESVDLWSVGCVFAELFTGKPFLKGKTEVEQLYKIFKLCGTPPDEYWRKSKLPLATMFKPQHHYESLLRERCKEFPETAVDLIETFLSIEPYKRGTATSALNSEYFSSMPYACDPSSLPQYPPSKEIDAKFREDARRKRAGSRMRASGITINPRKVRKPLQESATFSKAEQEQEVDTNVNAAPRHNNGCTHPKGKRAAAPDTVSEVSQVSQASETSQANTTCSAPVTAASSSFARDLRRKQDSVASRLHSKRTLRNNLHSNRHHDNVEHSTTRQTGQEELPKSAMQVERKHSHRHRV